MPKNSAGRKAKARGDVAKLEEMRRKREERETRQEQRKQEREKELARVKNQRRQLINDLGIADVVDKFDKEIK